MKTNCKSLLALIMVLSLLLMLFAGCGNSAADASASEDATVSAQDAAEEAAPEEAAAEAPAAEEPAAEASAEESASAAEEAAEEEAEAVYEPVVVELPICEEQINVTQWSGLHPLAVQYVSSGDDLLVYQQIAELTGIHFDVTFVGANAEEEQFNLMIATNDYTDIITGMEMYSSGISGAIEDDVIIDLYDYVQEYAPNYFHEIASDPAAYTSLVNTEGQMGTMGIMYKEKGLEDNGLMIRGDWVEEYGFDTILTYDDLYEYVKTIYTEKGIPMVLPSDGQLAQLSQGFGVIAGDYSAYDDVVKSYVETDGYYDYLSTMAAWYAEGIIDQDFVSRAGQSDLSNMFIADEASIGTAFATAMVGLNTTAEDPNAVYIGVANPRVNADDEYTISENTAALKDSDVWAISTQCDEDYIPALMELADWLLSDEGQLLYSYGTEGYSYELDETGSPQYSELITNNPDGYNSAVAAVLYATVYAPGIIDMRRDFYAMSDVGLEALDLFSSQNTGLNVLPSNITTYLTTEESEEYASVSSDVETYMDSMVLSFITGDEVLTEESYAAFVDTCIGMGLDQMDEIYQAAYDRYLETLAAVS